VMQLEYNARNHITPQTIVKAIRNSLAEQLQARRTARQAIHATQREYDSTELISELEAQMFEAAEVLEFEKAARLRDRIKQLKEAGAAKAVKE